MRTAIPLGLLLLVGAAAALHPGSPTVAEGRRVERAQAASPAGPPAETPAPTAPEGPRKAVPDPLPAAGQPEAAAARPKDGSAGKMAAQLDRELKPTPLQRGSLEQFLKERDAEIKAYHDGIARTGVIDLRQYEWQVDQMKDGWYRKIDAVLDRAQHERFLALVQQGFLNEGLAFTVEPGMTVLD